MIVPDNTTKMQKICFVCTVAESNVNTGIFTGKYYFGTGIVFRQIVLLLFFIKTMVSMKKIAVILVVCFFTALAVSSCNEKSCPAYAGAEATQTENVG